MSTVTIIIDRTSRPGDVFPVCFHFVDPTPYSSLRLRLSCRLLFWAGFWAHQLGYFYTNLICVASRELRYNWPVCWKALPTEKRPMIYAFSIHKSSYFQTSCAGNMTRGVPPVAESTPMIDDQLREWYYTEWVWLAYQTSWVGISMAWELYIITKSLLTISNPGCGCQNICTQLKMHPINAISEQQNSRQLKTNVWKLFAYFSHTTHSLDPNRTPKIIYRIFIKNYYRIKCPSKEQQNHLCSCSWER